MLPLRVGLLAAATLGGLLFCPLRAGADITSGAATGSVGFTVVPFGFQAGVGPGAIPQNPGNQAFGFGGIRGSAGFLPQTWDIWNGGMQGIASVANTVTTPFLNQEADIPAAAGAGLAILRADFSIDFSIDAAGVTGQTLFAAYGVGGLLGAPGGPGGFAAFEFDINYSHSVAGALGDLNGLISFTGSGPFSGGLSDSLVLPALSAGILTVSGFFELRVDDNPGDGFVTEIGVRPVPEPGTLLLLGAGAASAGYAGWRRRRAAALPE